MLEAGSEVHAQWKFDFDPPTTTEEARASNANLIAAGTAPDPPSVVWQALDPASRWGAEACGVEIRKCMDDEEKGLGAFATREFAKGDFVGVYWGERLTQHEFDIRHGWKNGAL